MGCTSCGGSGIYNPFNPYPKPNPCNPCNQKYDECYDAPQLAYVPGTACTIGITWHCMTSTLSLKEGIQNCETDTRFVWNSDTGCIDYHSERYVNQMEGSYIQSVCASQIASAINLCELNDVADTACDPENCALLVYTKNTDCGENCKGVNDMWAPWTVKNNLADYLTYVMGFNKEGCPVALDKPDTESEYWWAMWRGDNKFGYTQPTEVDELPRDENGQPIVIGQNPDGSPVVGPLDIEGYLNEKECTFIDPAPGFEISDHVGGGKQGNSLCYYKNQDTMAIVLDMSCTQPLAAKTYQALHIGTIHDPRFWPDIGDGDYIDLPLHVSPTGGGAFEIVKCAFDKNGRLILDGQLSARSAKEVIVNGIDDRIVWPWKG